jgi:hypothetical protein
MYTIPIADRPPHGPLSTKIFFPLFFNLAQIGLNSAQFASLPLLLIPFVGRRLYDAAIDWTKDGYGRLRECTSGLIVPPDPQSSSSPSSSDPPRSSSPPTPLPISPTWSSGMTRGT